MLHTPPEFSDLSSFLSTNLGMTKDQGFHLYMAMERGTQTAIITSKDGERVTMIRPIPASPNVELILGFKADFTDSFIPLRPFYQETIVNAAHDKESVMRFCYRWLKDSMIEDEHLARIAEQKMEDARLRLQYPTLSSLMSAAGATSAASHMALDQKLVKRARVRSEFIFVMLRRIANTKLRAESRLHYADIVKNWLFNHEPKETALRWDRIYKRGYKLVLQPKVNNVSHFVPMPEVWESKFTPTEQRFAQALNKIPRNYTVHIETPEGGLINLFLQLNAKRITKLLGAGLTTTLEGEARANLVHYDSLMKDRDVLIEKLNAD